MPRELNSTPLRFGCFEPNSLFDNSISSISARGPGVRRPIKRDADESKVGKNRRAPATDGGTRLRGSPHRVGYLGELSGESRAVGLGRVNDEVGRLLGGQVRLAEDFGGDVGPGFAGGQLRADLVAFLDGLLS